MKKDTLLLLAALGVGFVLWQKSQAKAPPAPASSPAPADAPIDPNFGITDPTGGW